MSPAGFTPDLSDLTVTGGGESEFEHARGVPAAASAATVFATTADAQASWNRTVRLPRARCMGYGFVVGAGGKATIASYQRVPFPKFAPRTAAFRTVVNMTVEEKGAAPQKSLMTMHMILLGRGRAAAGLLLLTSGEGAHTSDLSAFAKLLAVRLAAAKL